MCAVSQLCRPPARRPGGSRCPSRWTSFRCTSTPSRSPRVGTSDRNFYDRSYFNGHDRTGEIFFISGYGAYPNLGVKDAYFTIRIGDRSFTVRASDALDDDRLVQQVGFYRQEVVDPLNTIRLTGDRQTSSASAST